MTLSVIIPAFGNPDITFRAVSAVKMFGARGTKVILIDNGSPDEGVPALKHHVDKYIRLDPNRGPYGAVNAGLGVADTELVSVICNDVTVLPGTLQNLCAAVTPERPCIGAMGIVDGFDFYAATAVAAWRGLNQPRLVPGVCFSAFVARRDLFQPDSVGPFDERFGLTFGDTDWEQRYADSGKQYFLALNAPIVHGHGTTRKRGGIEADIKNDMRDYDAFAEKWKDRPDVLAKHPRETEAQKRAALTTFWQQGET